MLIHYCGVHPLIFAFDVCAEFNQTAGVAKLAKQHCRSKGIVNILGEDPASGPVNIYVPCLNHDDKL